jgi:hydrogenase maturation protease
LEDKLKIAIIGAGTVIFNDEGIGVYAQKYLEQNYNFDKEITFVDGGVLGFHLMTYYQEYDKVLILDTITMDNDTSGSIYNLPAEELLGLGSYKQTAHEVEIVEMLEICSLLERMADVTIIGIIPDDILSVSTNLSQKLKNSFENFIDTALNQIKDYGITYNKKDIHKNLDEIIYSYAYPKAQRELEDLK